MTRTKHMPRHLQTRTSLREQYQKPRDLHGKREAPPKNHVRGMARLVISSMLLIVVIGVKLTAPDVVDKYRAKVLNWMGQDTDFIEAFSAIGRAIGDKGIIEALNDTYVAVFGSSEERAQTEETNVDKNAVVYDAANTPENVTMVQQVLGFSYGNPVAGDLSSCFGYRDHPVEENEKFHYGLDIAAQSGEIIHAFADGTVTAVGESSDLGNYVEIIHENGYASLYAHCSKVTASSGQKVQQDDPIAEVGETGEATGPHLHFALYQDTLYLNPIYYVTL